MSRNVPTSHIGQIGAFDKDPIYGYDFYQESRMQNGAMVKEPNADSLDDTIDLLYLQNQLEHQKTEIDQSAMLKRKRQLQKLNEQKETQMEHIQATLRRKMQSTDEFMKSCRDKAKDAEKILEREQEHQEELKTKIEKAKTEYEELEDFKERLEQIVAKYEHYEHITDDLLKADPQYTCTKDIMDQCDALMFAQTDIRDMGDQMFAEIEDIRQQMIELTKQVSLEVLGLKNVLSEIERSLVEARIAALKWERTLTTTKDTIERKVLNKERTIDGIFQLYKMLVQRRGTQVNLSDERFALQRYEIGNVLDFIKEEFEMMRLALDDLNAEEGKIKTASEDDVLRRC